MALCQDGYLGFFGRWLAVPKDKIQTANDYFYKAANVTNNPMQRAGPEFGISTVRYYRGLRGSKVLAKRFSSNLNKQR